MPEPAGFSEILARSGSQGRMYIREEMERTVTEMLSLVREEIAGAIRTAGRSDLVRIMAVTKNHPVETVSSVIASGITTVGENRVSEGGRKIAALGRDAAEFHLIGPLHRRETRQACRDFHCIDSVDRAEILDSLAERVSRSPVPPVLVEVNTTPGEAKHGFSPDPDLLSRILERASETGIRIDGFLTVGPLSGGTENSRRAFSLLRELRDRVRSSTGLPLGELSMGMSDDFVQAVMEGATTVRLGRVLLGKRSALTR